MNTSFRIGLLISGNGEIPAWEAEMLHQLLNEKLFKEIVFISGLPAAKTRRSFGYRQFEKFESWWFRSSPDAFKTIPVSKEFKGLRIISLADNSTITSLNPDIIYCSCLADPGNIRARLGIWSIQFGTGRYQNAGIPAFHEVMHNESVTGAALKVQTEPSKYRIVYECETLTIPYSVKNNLNGIAWKASSFFPYRLKELAITGEESFFAKYKTTDIAETKWKSPGSLKMIWLFLKNGFGYLGYKLQKGFSKKKFTILYSRQAFEISNSDLKEFTSLTPPAKAFWADPFIVEKDGRNYVFFEESLAKSRNAHLSVIEINEHGTISNSVMVLQRPYHLSYPFVFEWEGHYYMLPETGSNRTVELYRAKIFPYEWEFVMNLMEDTVLIDPTLVYENKKWWLFGTTQNHPFTSTNDQLLLFYSNDLLSTNWRAHPANPVATKISNCRPAGKIFRYNDKLYRPAQNNASRQYGYGLNLNQIELMNELEYRESIVQQFIPGKENNLKAVHTLNFSENVVVVDGIRV